VNDDDRHNTEAATSRADGMPLSVRLELLLSPFSIFRNASRGDRFARAAAYRYNREMRVYLPGYLTRWSVLAALVLVLMTGAELLAGALPPVSTLLTLVAGAFGVAFTASVCVLFVTAYAYFYLSQVDWTDW
jgi:hypothetical protein